MFSLVYFPIEGCLEGVFPILLAQGEIPVSGSMPSSRWLPPLRNKQNKIEQGEPALHLNQASVHLNWRMGLPALLGGNLGCRIVLFPPILHSLWGVS